jgi:putative PEP-CTERM system TPR-repeat lipoprotein
MVERVMGLNFGYRLIVVCLAVAVMQGCGKGSLSETEYLEQAQAAIAEGETNVALIQLKSLLQLNPDNVQARQLLGLTLAELGNWPGAESALSRARELGAADALILVPLARALYEQRKYVDLLAAVTPANDMSADLRGAVHSYRSMAHLGQGATNEAELELDVARDFAPDLALTGIAAARVLVARGELAEARALVRSVLDSHPGESEAWALLGSIELELGASEEAESAFSSAIESSAAVTSDYLRRALVRISLKDFEGARSDLAASREQNPDSPGALYTDGLINYRQQRYAEAQTAFEKALSIAPGFTDALFYLGASNLAQGQLAQAEQNMARFLAVVPESDMARLLLAISYNRQGKPQSTIDILDSLSKSPEADPQLLIPLAEAYLQKNDADSALRLYQRIADLSFDQAGSLQLTIGLLQLQTGAEEKAMKSLAAVTEEPYAYRAALARVHYFMNMSRFDEALAVADELEQAYPQQVGTHNLKAQAYLAKNDPAKARSSLERALELNPEFTPAALGLARLDIDEGNPAGAAQRYQAMLKADGKNISALVGLAELAQLAGRDADQLKWLQRAVAASSTSVVPRVGLVNYHLAHDEYREALSVARRFAGDNPNSPQALAVLGKTQMKGRQYRDALVTFSSMMELVPTSANGYLEMARAYSALGENDNARGALTKALEYEPRNLRVIYTLGTLEAGLGNGGEAMRMARLYRQIEPDSAVGDMLEADALMTAGRAGEAAEIYRKVLSKRPNGRIAVKWHQALSQAGNEDADSALLSWLASHDQDAFATAYLARSYMGRGQREQAIEQYELLVARGAATAEVLNNLANLYQQAGDPRDLDTANRARELDASDPAIADTLGWILVSRGKLDEGLKLVRQAAEAAPDPEVHYHLAYALEKSGQDQEALAVIGKIRAMPLSNDLRARVDALATSLSSG